MDFRSPRRSGDFHLARLLADGLLDGGTMWTWQDRSGQPHVETADRECLFRGIPLVVIVDSDVDATAAHVAAALQDAGRATIVGEAPTAGGVIVNAFPCCDGQYYVMLESAKLFRSRADRTWPLCPDEQVDMSVKALNASMVKMNAFFNQRGVEPGSQSVSALFPTNMTLKESVSRLVPSSLIPGLPRPMGQQANDAARKVALRLLKQLDELQLEAVN
jgi:C-terminal processing protease CtpA/Prc